MWTEIEAVTMFILCVSTFDTDLLSFLQLMAMTSWNDASMYPNNVNMLMINLKNWINTKQK